MPKGPQGHDAKGGAVSSSSSATPDLTGLMQYSQKLEEQGLAPPPVEGALMEEAPLEKISEFESLDAYAAAHPVPEVPVEQPSAAEDFPISEASELPPANAWVNEAETAIEAGPGISEAQGASESEFSLPQEEGEDAFSPPAESLPLLEPTPHRDEGALESFNPLENSVNSSPQAPAPSSLDASPPLTPREPVENLRKFSEQLPIGKPHVPASFPFSVLIRGRLNDWEKEKLLSVLESHQMGIRPMDLEPQLENHQILIPRISEYAAVLLVQALRGVRAEIRVGPSDSIFSTELTQQSESEGYAQEHNEAHFGVDESHPAESLPLSSLDHLPGIGPQSRLQVLDTLTASASLKTQALEVESSSLFQQTLEALKKELKYKAHRKGATAILDFKLQLIPLTMATHYRLVVSGVAVELKSAPSPDSAPLPPFHPEK
ncbi:MAG: hypothetical protein ACO3A2_08075 [Bdellovibrionia bacterium]